VFLYTITLVPARVKTLGSFPAPDPWNNQRPSDFTIEAHRLLPKNAAHAPRDTGPPYILGIRSEIDGAVHLMPESLSELWNTGRAPAEALPRLLHTIEPSLKNTDFRFYLHATRHLWMLGVCGLIALAAFIAVALQSAVSQPHITTQRLDISAEDWLKTPMQEMRLIRSTSGLTTEGSLRLTAPTRIPGFAGGYSGKPDALAWVKAAEGRRLLLISGPLADFGVERLYLSGLALRRGAIGLPHSVLQDLRAKLPDLNTNLILCVGWYPNPTGRSVRLPPWFGIAIGVIVLAAALPVFIVIRSGQTRRRRQMDHLLALLGAKA